MIKNYIPDKKRVLVLSPHPDDEVIGCGGVLLRFASKGSLIHCLYLNRGEQSKSLKKYKSVIKRVSIREKEVKKVTKEIGIKSYSFLYEINEKISDRIIEKKIEKKIKIFKPEIIFVPWHYEMHPEHRLFGQYLAQINIEIGILKDTEVFAYEVWSPISCPNICVDITDQIERKKELLGMYDSVMQDIDYIRTSTGLNKYRSIYIQDGKGFSESFIRSSLREYLASLKERKKI